MDAFSYLSVLYSIILGLAITQVLQGYRALLLARARIVPHVPTFIWSVALLLFATQSWWASFGLARHRHWTFLAFAALLLQTVLLYMMAALVLPDVAPGERVDLPAHYRRETTPFFALFLAILATSLAKELLVDGRLPTPGNLGFHLTFAACAVAALASRRPGLHVAIAVAIVAITLAYIGFLFATL